MIERKPTRQSPHQPPKRVQRLESAPHIRGRVFKAGHLWRMEVLNTLTGQVLAADNTGHWAPMRDLADETVGAVRRAWLQGFGSKAVHAR